MVHQQFKLVETLTGFENISLGLHRGRLLQPTGTDDRIRALMAEVGFEIDLAARVWQMTLAERQQLELLRTLAVGARVLILDEPTSVLSPLETGRLFGIIRRIAASGRRGRADQPQAARGARGRRSAGGHARGPRGARRACRRGRSRRGSPG